MSSTVGELFDVLITGKKIALTFETEGKFFSFRSKLYAYKLENETAMIDLEILSGPKSISITTTDDKSGTYVFQLVDKIERITRYDFTILPDEED